ncbi:MAG: DUF1501 domain-containing protein [Verrucomicrobiales bacterium]|nr:DUF1501 domain-containing protein [Verrucomicrobiales bacterium]
MNTLPATRREFLSRTGMGMGALGLSPFLSSLQASNRSLNPLAPGATHFPARAKRVIHIFANGGPSQVDSFDYKPELEKYHGKEVPGEHLRTERKTGTLMKSPFNFSQHGESGIWASDLFPKVSEMVDDLCIINSMHANVPNHEPSLMLMNTGAERVNLVRPSMGSWVTYGLGTENENLPGFVSLCPGGVPIVETQNWRSAFLPGAYQGTHIDTKNTNIAKLIPDIRNPRMPRELQRKQLDLIQEMNRQDGEDGGLDPDAEARIHSLELAYKMQIEATDAFNVEREPESVRKLYGETLHGRQMLIARRLVERGVRFVQVWHGAGQPWDSHAEIAKNHGKLGQEADQPIAALLTDLKQRGLLEDTLVIWGGEFGRTPTVELPTPGSNAANTKLGRDHNHHGFTMWMAGGGVKSGFQYGKSDDFGFKAVENRMHVHDLHATILHLLGFDHEKLTYRYAGRDFRLTDVHGEVFHDLLA